ncbi:MBL fold metallo-hydrolase [Paludibacter sp.]|uniref:MBL fold metallo-hydrolase n=1 Tax=Paludibacter sp. TaxID=1898105 RepID=UPI001353A31A|nr:MBL fold metallo-hydrolase [Paludibacter sp.]MTK54460.1 MBL fold metallo-hydrolase [Paludibacter sp.]
MKKIIGLILALTIYSSAFSQVRTSDLHVTYIANEGFMLKTKHHKILIDALFTDGYGYFATPTKELLDQIMNAKAPFDSINFCFLTHYHKDHSDSKLMNDYLSKFPSAKLITTKPSLVFIDGEQFRFVKLQKQFCELTPETNKSIKRTIDNVTVTALGLKHMSYIEDGIDIEQYMKNVGFYINMDGVRIFHSGDTKMEQFKDYMAKNGQWKEPVNVAFVNYELLNGGKVDLDYLKKTLNPKYIIVMHVPPTLYEEWAKKVEQLKQTFPGIILFKDALESKTLNCNF